MTGLAAFNRNVHEVKEILEVWKVHFSKLGTPAQSDNFDKEHFDRVNSRIRELIRSEDNDVFTQEHISFKEVVDGVNRLNSGKAPGFDGVTKEHIYNAGYPLVRLLVLLCNWVLDTEHIPINFRRGIQIPLYKGKNTSTFDVNNYRGITLLSVFNKLFEVILWNRMEEWWNSSGVINQLQGACKKGISCVHSTFILQETIATLLEKNRKVFVLYLDVSKAFDGVWVEGLFYRLWEMGVRGKTWRLLYKSYQDFKCRVRIQNQMSEWYPLRCGIHQGGYLSLLKYLAFINSLLDSLEESKLCCAIYGINVSPLGYADDIASASTSKANTDRVLQIVYNHSCTWRYKFNPKKSAVLVYGESEHDNRKHAKFRTYMLGKDRIKEGTTYDHLGLKNNNMGINVERTTEKISKGRKALNAASGLGLKSGGLTIKACSMLFWAMVIPIITFACEMWILCDNDIKLLEDFQIYAGRRIQRFHQSSPRETSYVSLGWLRIELYIYVKKLLFIRSIAVLDDESIIKKIFIKRSQCFKQNSIQSCENSCNSPAFDLLRVAEIFDMSQDVDDLLNGNKTFSKRQWKSIVWEKAWDFERQDWDIRKVLFKTTKYLKVVVDDVQTLIWWKLGDKNHGIMSCCETMSKLVCKSSRLKSDYYLYRSQNMYCDLCQDLAYEDAEHLIMHCKYFNKEREEMFAQLQDIERLYNTQVIRPLDNNFHLLIGKFPIDTDENLMYNMLKIIAVKVDYMYRVLIKKREGVG